jgi:hypothetical protein
MFNTDQTAKLAAILVTGKATAWSQLSRRKRKRPRAAGELKEGKEGRGWTVPYWKRAIVDILRRRAVHRARQRALQGKKGKRKCVVV